MPYKYVALYEQHFYTTLFAALQTGDVVAPNPKPMVAIDFEPIRMKPF